MYPIDMMSDVEHALDEFLTPESKQVNLLATAPPLNKKNDSNEEHIVFFFLDDDVLGTVGYPEFSEEIITPTSYHKSIGDDEKLTFKRRDLELNLKILS